LPSSPATNSPSTPALTLGKRIERALRRSHLADVKVSTVGDLVNLSGQVPDDASKTKARRIAAATKGVREVFDYNLKTQSAITLDRVIALLHAKRRFQHVDATIDGCTVTLVGLVYDDDAKAAAETAANSFGGVCSVMDNLGTQMEQANELILKITHLLEQGGLHKVTVNVIGHDCFLKGEVSSERDREKAIAIAEGNGLTCAPIDNFIRVVPHSWFGFGH